MVAYAHSANASGERHLLADHLRETARLTADFAEPLGARDLGHYLGLWHDIGKFDPSWQQYLLDAEVGRVAAGTGPDHKAAGTQLARQHCGLPALVIQGHHGGLPDLGSHGGWLKDRGSRPGVASALGRAAASVIGLTPVGQVGIPAFLQGGGRGPASADAKRTAELFVRLMFSALVDADSLDTERHDTPERAASRGRDISMADLWRRLEARLLQHPAAASSVVQEARTEILDACLSAAELPPGLFRLAAPTGGGKTLSGLAFALRHAERHGLRRVVVAVPFISITEQTAAVYRGVLGEDGDEGPAVLEHHSGSRELIERADESPDGDFHPGANWSHLAAENWDAPVVVTTTVQLFESLFARKRTACRKLHRLAGSVVILDEVQALPVHLLDPILDVLRELCENYGTTVLLSTATQPAFETVPALRYLPAHDVLPEPAPLFKRLQRVQYDWRTDTPLPWGAVAEIMAGETQGLAILNTKKDALALLDALDVLGVDGAVHLSTLLCGAHRRRVLADVRQRLKGGEPCLLVSTQVVEAGVDLDFPLVLRALGPLDGIIQAAGRCNREGRLGIGEAAGGRMIIFAPEGGGMPPGTYQLGQQMTKALRVAASHRERDLDPNDPDLYRRYSKQLLALAGTDAANIQQLRASLDYPQVAEKFRMIDGDTESLIITDYGAPEERRLVRSLLDGLRDPHRADHAPRVALRMLQPYTVTVRSREAKSYRQRGLMEDVRPAHRPEASYGVSEWQGRYDDVRGLVADGQAADRFVV